MIMVNILHFLRIVDSFLMFQPVELKSMIHENIGNIAEIEVIRGTARVYL